MCVGLQRSLVSLHGGASDTRALVVSVERLRTDGPSPTVDTAVSRSTVRARAPLEGVARRQRHAYGLVVAVLARVLVAPRVASTRVELTTRADLDVVA